MNGKDTRRAGSKSAPTDSMYISTKVESISPAVSTIRRNDKVVYCSYLALLRNHVTQALPVNILNRGDGSFLLLQSSTYKIPNDHDNYCGYDDYENMFCGNFVSCLSKRNLCYAHQASISSLRNVFVLRKRRIMSQTRITLQFLGRFTINQQFDRGKPSCANFHLMKFSVPNFKREFLRRRRRMEIIDYSSSVQFDLDSFPKQTRFNFN